MLSIPDMALLGAAALLLFGPDQLPRVARKAGNVMRDIQNTSQSFIREMERAADLAEAGEHASDPGAAPYEPAPYDAAPVDLNATLEPLPGEHEAARGVAEQVAEPRPALDLRTAADEHGGEPFDPPPRVERSPDRPRTTG